MRAMQTVLHTDQVLQGEMGIEATSAIATNYFGLHYTAHTKIIIRHKV